MRAQGTLGGSSLRAVPSPHSGEPPTSDTQDDTIRDPGDRQETTFVQRMHRSEIPLWPTRASSDVLRATQPGGGLRVRRRPNHPETPIRVT